MIVRSAAIDSSLNSNRSWSVITSDSIRCTSVICDTRREPSSNRSRLNDQVERRRNLLADRADRQVVARHQHHRLEPVQASRGEFACDGRHRAVVARVHRLEHVECLGAADLADDDPVGSHAQGVAHELADRDLALTLDVLRPRLEAEHVLLMELKLRRVLDRDDPVGFGNRSRKRVQERRLAGAGTARDQDVQLRLTQRRGTRPPRPRSCRG